MASKKKNEISIPNFDQNNNNNKPDVNLVFQNAANEVTRFYHQAINLQQIAFDAGRKHSLTKAFEWVSSQIRDGKSVSSADVMAYVQNELGDSNLPTNSRLRLDTSAQRSGSNHSHTSRDAQVEADSASSLSGASIGNRGPGAFSRDQDMDVDA
ncbi:hypothetical protein OSB04_013470 [Centaurea solstitialis]|uniref:Uncharacterized protein n=1 Tax=Centaurea solstitialis TaxID=347529 RepID=A0AA38TR94_9ASTR|nr:hypothetical protein OSB04_013470 [Centaurea solstitialis]